MRALARRLVRDDAHADDIVQDTWLAAMKRPWRQQNAATAWLSRVVRNLSARKVRGAVRSRRREEAVARSESQSHSPQELVERAELQQRMVAEVTGLEEPYRSTILLRFFEDKSVRDLASLQDVPAATVAAWPRARRNPV